MLRSIFDVMWALAVSIVASIASFGARFVPLEFDYTVLEMLSGRSKS